MASGIPDRRRSPEGDLQLSRIVRKLECGSRGASALVPTRRRPAPKRPRQASCQAPVLRTIRDAPTHS